MKRPLQHLPYFSMHGGFGLLLAVGICANLAVSEVVEYPERAFIAAHEQE